MSENPNIENFARAVGEATDAFIAALSDFQNAVTAAGETAREIGLDLEEAYAAVYPHVLRVDVAVSEAFG